MMVTGTTLSMSMAGIGNALAANFTFQWQGDTGYTATGSFSTQGDTLPEIISEAAGSTVPFTTQFLDSLSLNVFDPSNNLVDSGSSVINGVSNNAFLLFTYNTQTNDLSEINTNAESPGEDTYYFLGNNVDPSGNPVPAGSTAYNLFQYTTSTDTYNFLGAASSVQVTAVPEPSSTAGILALGVLGAGYLLKHQFKKQKQHLSLERN